MNGYADVLNIYNDLNKFAGQNPTVFFGADWLSGIPVAELARDNNISSAVYNRSIMGLKLSEAEDVIDTCVCSLYPGKVFINIGENDIYNEVFDEDEFLEKYEWLLYTLNAKCRCEIYILSVINDKNGKINNALKKISDKYGCVYIDVAGCRCSAIDFFARIRFFLRCCPMTFFEAMQ